MKKLLVSVVAVGALLGVVGSIGCTEEVKTGEEAFVYVQKAEKSKKTTDVIYRMVDTGNSVTFIKTDEYEDGVVSKEFVEEYVSNVGEDYDINDDIIIVNK